MSTNLVLMALRGIFSYSASAGSCAKTTPPHSFVRFKIWEKRFQYPTALVTRRPRCPPGTGPLTAGRRARTARLPRSRRCGCGRCRQARPALPAPWCWRCRTRGSPPASESAPRLRPGGPASRAGHACARPRTGGKTRCAGAPPRVSRNRATRLRKCSPAGSGSRRTAPRVCDGHPPTQRRGPLLQETAERR
jgi:hypothetical protein